MGMSKKVIKQNGAGVRDGRCECRDMSAAGSAAVKGQKEED